MIIDILSSIIIAFAFFTIIPVAKLEWSGKRMKFVPLMMPLVGFVNGLLSFLLFNFLNTLNFSAFFKAIIMCLYYVIFTGGLHIDGLLDTADAYFSRRDKARKLEIMKDPTLGTFAVITLIFLFLIKIAVFNELFMKNNISIFVIIFIPVISRILQSSMLYLFPPAKANGLARMFGELDKRFSVILFVLLLFVGTCIYFLIGVKAIIFILVILVYYSFFYFSSKKQFGGITGDLLGAFLEISELLMLITLLLIN